MKDVEDVENQRQGCGTISTTPHSLRTACSEASARFGVPWAFGKKVRYLNTRRSRGKLDWDEEENIQLFKMCT